VVHQPRGQEIHVIADNLSAHKTKQVDAFLCAHPNVHMHFTPTYSSWLNQVELWFAKIERDVIARGVFTSVPDLKRKLMRYIRHYNKQPKPVKWKYFDPTRRITPVASYAEFDKSGAPKAIGVVFSAGALDALPAAPSDGHRCFDANNDGVIDLATECSGWHERVLPVPSEASRRPDVPFKWAKSSNPPKMGYPFFNLIQHEESAHESLHRPRHKPEMGNQRSAPTRTRPQPGADQDARQRHLLHRRSSDQGRVTRRLPPNSGT
jgi:transposase